MEKQGNLQDHYFAQMLFEGQKRLQKFAPQEPRPLYYNEVSNGFREKIPNLDDLIETNEELKKN